MPSHSTLDIRALSLGKERTEAAMVEVVEGLGSGEGNLLLHFEKGHLDNFKNLPRHRYDIPDTKRLSIIAITHSIF